MSIVSSTHELGVVQRDGRRYVVEDHVDNIGKHWLIEYLAAATTDYTIVVCAAPVSSGSASDLFLCGDSLASNYRQIIFAANASYTIGNVAGKFALQEYDGGFMQRAETSATTYCDSNPHVYGASTGRSATASLYFDGVSQAIGSSGTSASTVSESASSITCIGSDADSSRNANYPIYMAAVWLRVLSDAEHAEIGENPWQLFQPEQRRVVYFTGLYLSLPLTSRQSQTPGGPFVNETGTAQRQVPGWGYINETISVAGITLQYIYPVSDIAAGGWTPSTGSDLYATIAEASPNDGDDDRSSWAPNNDTMRVQMGAPATTPTSDTDHTFSYRLTSENFIAKCDVKIYNNTTWVVTYTHAAVPLGVTQYDQVLSSGEAAALGDRSNVQVEVIAYQ